MGRFFSLLFWKFFATLASSIKGIYRTHRISIAPFAPWRPNANQRGRKSRDVRSNDMTCHNKNKLEKKRREPSCHVSMIELVHRRKRIPEGRRLPIRPPHGLVQLRFFPRQQQRQVRELGVKGARRALSMAVS